jgi:two-component system, LytTR family, response regulator
MNVLIVDDEVVARRGLRRQLDEMPGVTCVGECGGVADAIGAIVDRRPDVVLLDVQLGRQTAFDIIEQVGVDVMPIVVFVTAYDRHAVKAFEVHALDYVLKPVDPVRLQEALERAVLSLALRKHTPTAERFDELARTQAERPGHGPVGAQRFVVRDGERLLVLESGQIDWFESAGNQVRVHTGGRAFLMRTTMDRVSRRLADDDFVRVRRSAIVSVRAIASFERYAKSSYLVRLHDGTKIVSSRFYLAAVRRLLHAPSG